MTFDFAEYGDESLYRPPIDINELEAFEEELRRVKKDDIPIPTRRVDGKEVAWEPFPGSQVKFLKCPAFEVLYHGTRGPGKTDALLMSFLQHVGKWGRDWRGMIIRQTYKELADVMHKANKWVPLIFGERAKYNKQNFMWEWESGEVLMFRHLMKEDDYNKYHGHEIPFLGFEELTNYPTPDVYLSMFSVLRSSNPDVPKMVRATCNPSGPGHNWVKKRFNLGGEFWRTQIMIENNRHRVAIFGHMRENLALMRASPDYAHTIVASGATPAKRDAWLLGSWAITSGGMFDDVWEPEHHIVKDFDIPKSWKILRSYDYGSSRPFSFGWYAVSNGTAIEFADGGTMNTQPGDVFRVREYYGCETGHGAQDNVGLRMSVDAQAEEMLRLEEHWGLRNRINGGIADQQCFTREAHGKSIAQMFSEHGIHFHPCEKGAGSRIAGWEEVRRYLIQACPDKQGLRSKPGLYIIGKRNPHFIRTFPTLPRDEKTLDDVDTDAEDHIADELRYLIRFLAGYRRPNGSLIIG